MLRLGEVRIAGGDRAGGMEEMERGWKLVADRLGMAHPITRSATERVAVQYETAGQPALAARWRARVAP